MDAERLISDYVAAYRDGREVSGEDPRFAAIEELDRLAHDEPELAWDLILRILEQDQSRACSYAACTARQNRDVGRPRACSINDEEEFHGKRDPTP